MLPLANCRNERKAVKLYGYVIPSSTRYRINCSWWISSQKYCIELCSKCPRPRLMRNVMPRNDIMLVPDDEMPLF